MPKLTTALKTLATPNFWVDALVIIGGNAASAFLNRMVGARIPAPALVQQMVGPVLVIFGGSLVGDRHGRNLKLGAAVNAATTALGALGVLG